MPRKQIKKSKKSQDKSKSKNKVKTKGPKNKNKNIIKLKTYKENNILIDENIDEDFDEISTEEINDIFRAIDENEFILEYNNDIYNNETMPEEIYYKTYTKEEEIRSIPLEFINAFNKLKKLSKNLHHNSLNYDFIKN